MVRKAVQRWHPSRGAWLINDLFPVVSLRSTTGYRLESLRDSGVKTPFILFSLFSLPGGRGFGVIAGTS